MHVRWRIEMLGGLRAVQGDRVLTRFRTQKTGVLLAYLAYYLKRTHPRDALIELFWPDGDPSTGRNNLSRELSWLRRQLESQGVPPGTVIAADRAAIGLTPEAVATDVAAFEAALCAAERAGTPAERARHLGEAIEGYAGELLPGYYDGWILQEREWLADRYFQALGQLLAHLEQTGEISQALEYARQGVRVDPLREEAHRDLIRLLAAAGQPGAALRQYRELERLLKQELDVEPAAATQALARDIERLRDRSPQFLPSSPIPELPRPSAHPHNLPLQLTSFIGREQAMAEVQQLLATHRLVTLVGAGGCGKTRLALQVAGERLESFAEGVRLVELAALADPALVPQTVAAALGLREEPSRPMTLTLTDYLRPRSLLLLLDNCEHLLAASAQLADALLKACPHLQILASSREGLGIVGEQSYRVPPLSLPDRKQLPPAERLCQFEAVRLFVERAVLSQPSFALEEANAAAVAQICQRLDGIPLAIELAASRVKALPVEQIAARLDDRFRLLTGGSRTALPRQQTLRALIDWSYDLLSEPERVLLHRLSVFAGGWTLEAAEAVCSGDGQEEWEVLDLLTRLVEKSLVQYEAGKGEGRFRLLETVRQYGRDRLGETKEVEAVHAHHLEFFVQLAERAAPELIGAEQAAWLERLETEHDNLRTAMGWAEAEGQGEEGLRLVGSLWRFWLVRGHLEEGRGRLGQVLALPGTTARTAARAKALPGAGLLAWAQSDYARARSLLEESLAICREVGDRGIIAGLLYNLGLVAWGQGDYAGARSLHEECLAIKRKLGDQGELAYPLRSLGRVAQAQGDYARARSLLEESLAICRELQDRGGIAYSFNVLGSVALARGDNGAAQALFEESLAIFRELGDKGGIITDLEEMAEVAVAHAQAERAARLFGAAEGLRDALGAPLPRADRTEDGLSVAAVRAALGEEAFAAAWAAGRAMSLEQAIALALDDTSEG
jgi:predicted ATPase/DNA-binding SARP family transcriptional activator